MRKIDFGKKKDLAVHTADANDPLLTDLSQQGKMKKDLQSFIESPGLGADGGVGGGDSVRTLENVKTVEGGNSFIVMDGYTTGDRDPLIDKSIDNFREGKIKESVV